MSNQHMKITIIHVCTGELQAGINKTLEAFEEVLQLYQSGPHLDNLPPALLRGRSLVPLPLDSGVY